MRVVSLCPSLTELVFDLGRGDALVGRTRFCVHPADGVARVERVGGTKNPKVGRIVALAPDLVLLNEEENRREDAEALAAAGLRCHASFPRTPGETATMVRDIAQALDAREAGERLAVAIEEEVVRASARARARPAVRYAYLIWREPWMAVNDDTFIAGMLATAGGVNVFGAHTARYPVITPAMLAGAAPDAVLLSSEPFPFTTRHAEELAAATGIGRDRFVPVDGELLSWHGSRTPRGVRYASELLAGLAAAR